MSDDLVKQLRAVAEATGPNDARRIAYEAAARIEQLEREAQLQAQEIDKTRRRADKWQSMVLDCEKYLKPEETPRQRMDRDHADVLALMKLLETEKRRVDRLKSAIDMVDRYSQSAHVAHDMKIGIFPERSTVSEYLSEIIRAKIQENSG